MPATVAEQGYTKVELLTLTGPEYRHVSTAPTRPATSDEIPIIDLDGLWFYNGDEATKAKHGGSEAAAKSKARIAATIRAAATGAGFFYVSNHGIPEPVLAGAQEHSQRFFSQPMEDKMKVFSRQRPLGNGYSPVRLGQINKTETKDFKEGFQFRYQPEYDPLHAEATEKFAEELSQGDDWVWEKTENLPGFKEATIAWWQNCLQLARGLVKLFALALELPEDYFDALTTHPGSDGLYICYPGLEDPEAEAQADKPIDVGIGSHTDMQCFTLLWQDQSGGLEVLLKKNDDTSGDDHLYEWVGATPQPGTMVVNIADFLQRLSNDKFRSTVHRVYNRQVGARYSMPFFFGFNYDSECAVVPTCVDETHPARYAPISCGKWRDERMKLATVRQAT